MAPPAKPTTVSALPLDEGPPGTTLVPLEGGRFYDPSVDAIRGGGRGLSIPGARATPPTSSDPALPGASPPTGGRVGTRSPASALPSVYPIEPATASSPSGTRVGAPTGVPVAVPRTDKSPEKVEYQLTFGGYEYVVKTQGFAELSYPKGRGPVDVKLGTNGLGMSVDDGRFSLHDPAIQRIAVAWAHRTPPQPDSFEQNLRWVPSVELGQKKLPIPGPGVDAKISYGATVKDGHPAVETTVSVKQKIPAPGGPIEVTYGVQVSVEKIRSPQPGPPQIPALPQIPAAKLTMYLVILAAIAALGSGNPRPRPG